MSDGWSVTKDTKTVPKNQFVLKAESIVHSWALEKGMSEITCDLVIMIGELAEIMQECYQEGLKDAQPSPSAPLCPF